MLQMRRGFSILLILFFGLGPLSAFVDSSEDAGLPACCRRHGAHHCAMYAEIMAMRAGRGIDPTPSFSASPTCPLYHGPTFSILIPAHALGGSGGEGSGTVHAYSRSSVRAHCSVFNSRPCLRRAWSSPLEPQLRIALKTVVRTGCAVRKFRVCNSQGLKPPPLVACVSA